MSGRIGTANEACFALACSLSQTKGVNLGVTAFPACDKNGIFPVFSEAVFVAPILKHGEKVHTNFHLEAKGGTPLTEALWWTLVQLHKQKEERKIILLITDGEPEDKESALHAIDTIQSFGVEIYGISLPPCNLDSMLPRKNIAINHVNELTKNMFGLL